MTTTNQSTYESFVNKRDDLLLLIDEQLDLLSTLNIDTWQSTIQNLKENVSKDVFSVLVLGEFKGGKSTLINALLGEEILPAYILPCTAIINEIKWGESSQAIIHYKPSEDGTQQKSETISIDQLEEYVVIPHDQGDSYVSPYEKVEIFWPLQLCKHSVEIIDSPGLNENRTREQITNSYLQKADALLFIFSCEKALATSELDSIRDIQKCGHEDIFFVGTRWDSVRTKEKEIVTKYVNQRLSSSSCILPEKQKERIFFVSATNALDGRLQNNEDLVTNSGVPELEKKTRGISGM